MSEHGFVYLLTCNYCHDPPTCSLCIGTTAIGCWSLRPSARWTDMQWSLDCLRHCENAYMSPVVQLWSSGNNTTRPHLSSGLVILLTRPDLTACFNLSAPPTRISASSWMQPSMNSSLYLSVVCTTFSVSHRDGFVGIMSDPLICLEIAELTICEHTCCFPAFPRFASQAACTFFPKLIEASNEFPLLAVVDEIARFFTIGCRIWLLDPWGWCCRSLQQGWCWSLENLRCHFVVQNPGEHWVNMATSEHIIWS